MSYSIVSKASQIYSNSETTPPILSKADFWVDMSDTNCYTLTTASRIATVVDKSASPKTVTKVGSALSFDTIGKGIRFTSGNYLTIALSSPGTVSATSVETIFLVVTQYDGSAGGFIGSSTTGVRTIRSGANLSYTRTGSGGITSNYPIPYSVKFVYSAVLLNGTANQYFNGSFDGSNTITFTAQVSTQDLGQANGAGVPFRGNLYEIIIFQSALNDTLRRSIENYLINKWKIDTTNTISSPLSVSGCTLWLDGNDASTLTYSSGTVVSQWNDKSGNGYNATQSTVSQQPVYDTTLKGLKFTQANNSGMVTSAPWSRTETVFAVLNLSATGGNVIGTTNASRGRQIRLATGNLRIYSDSAIISQSPLNTLTTTDKYVYTYFNSVTDAYYETNVNCIQDIESNAALNFTAGSFNNIIGSSTSGATIFSYDSYIYELIVFNSALSSANRLAINRYLFNKWSGIVNGPVKNGRFAFYISPPINRFFRPVDFANLTIWLDASDVSTLTLSGTNITQWRDKSGNGNTATAGNNPVYAANTLNRLGTIRLRASNDYFLVNNHLTTTDYPSLCYFIVLNPSSTQPNTSYAGVLSTDTAAAYGRSLGFGGGSYQEEYYSNFLNITPYTAGSWAIVCLQFTTTAAATLRVNGVSYSGTASGTGTNTTNFKIGSYNSTNGYADFNANFDVAEILVFGANLGLYQQQVIEGYLAWKWGLQNTLTSTHLYKTTFPATDIFDVRSISNIVLWADGSNTSSLTLSGTNVTAWADTLQFCGSTTNYAGTATYSTTTKQLSFDGATVLQFNNSNANAFFQNISYMICFAVFSTSATNGVVFCSASSSGGLLRFDARVSGQKLQINARRLTTDAVSTLNGATTIPLNTLILATFIADTSSNNDLFVFLNGTQDATSSPFATTGNTSNTADDFVSIAGRSSLVSHPALSGTIAEVVVYNRILTTFQRQQIEGELAWKWGIQSSLPSTHPYYKYPPF